MSKQAIPKFRQKRYHHGRLLKIIVVVLLMSSNNIYSQNNNDHSILEQKPSVKVLFGPQFNGETNSETSMIIGGSFDLHIKDKISLPLEFILHFIRSGNLSNNTIFPRVIPNIRYSFIKEGKIDCYLQGGVGIPLLFPYLFDFSPTIGFSYDKIQIDIRNTFIFNFETNNNFSVNRWQMVAVIVGLAI